MELVQLELVLHRAPLVIIDGLLMDEDLWRFDDKEIRCGQGDGYWVFPHQEVELPDNGRIVAKNHSGHVVHIEVIHNNPFTAKDLP